MSRCLRSSPVVCGRLQIDRRKDMDSGRLVFPHPRPCPRSLFHRNTCPRCNSNECHTRQDVSEGGGTKPRKFRSSHDRSAQLFKHIKAETRIPKIANTRIFSLQTIFRSKNGEADATAKREDPPTTQAFSAAARSSRPPSCKQSSEEQGRQKLDNQK